MTKMLSGKYGNRVEVRYFDTDLKAPGAYPLIANLIQMGYTFPLIFINGEHRLAGGIDFEKIQDILDEMSMCRKIVDRN